VAAQSEVEIERLEIIGADVAKDYEVKMSEDERRLELLY
jgi:hypothetical protein